MSEEIKLVPIVLSQVEALKKQGYEMLKSGDAAQANSDYFCVMVKEKNGKHDVRIICPTFLKKSIYGLGITEIEGCISY